jgi:hypothetical protein
LYSERIRFLRPGRPARCSRRQQHFETVGQYLMGPALSKNCRARSSRLAAVQGIEDIGGGRAEARGRRIAVRHLGGAHRLRRFAGRCGCGCRRRHRSRSSSSSIRRGRGGRGDVSCRTRDVAGRRCRRDGGTNAPRRAGASVGRRGHEGTGADPARVRDRIAPVRVAVADGVVRVGRAIAADSGAVLARVPGCVITGRVVLAGALRAVTGVRGVPPKSSKSSSAASPRSVGRSYKHDEDRKGESSAH